MPKHPFGSSDAPQLCGDHRVAGGVVLPDLQLAAHLAPDAHVAPVYLAAVVAAGTLREGEEEEEGQRTCALARTRRREAGGGLTGMLWRSRMLERSMQETTQQKSRMGMQQHQP